MDDTDDRKSMTFLFTLSPFLGVFAGLYVFNNAFLSLLIYHLCIASAVIFRRKEISIKEVICVRNPAIVVAASLLCASAGGVVYLLWEYIKIPSLDLTQRLAQYQLSGAAVIPFAICFSLVNPILEELFWRFLQKPESSLLSLDDIFFGSYHLFVVVLFLKPGFALLCAIAMIAAGRIWRFFREQLHEGLALIVTHAIADFSVLMSVLYFCR